MNIHANAMVSLLTASNPNTHVTPSNGNNIMADFSDALHKQYKELTGRHIYSYTQKFKNATKIVANLVIYDIITWLCPIHMHS